MKRLPRPENASRATMQKRVAEVVDLFEREQGRLDWNGEQDPLEGLVMTLLSHNTNDRNRDIAYGALWDRYDSWDEIANADFEELAAVVRPAGLNRQKAERIQALLRYLRETYGEYAADFLKEMEFDEALETLGHLKGVSFKTMSVVMCFDLGRDIFPVDTHVHRICRRIGFVPDSYTAVKTFHAMRPLVPEGKSHQFHLHLINHGRQICDARKPKCDRCFVYHLCRYGRYGSGLEGPEDNNKRGEKP